MFTNRAEAGMRLATLLDGYADVHPIVLALPRGGVPVALPVARHLAAPLDVLVVRKLRVPWQPELGFGAVGEAGIEVLNRELIAHEGIDDDTISAAIDAERREVEARVERYRGKRPPRDIAGRTVIIVDDGLATGSTALAAIDVVLARGAQRVVVATPVAPQDTVERLEEVADEVICAEVPRIFSSIGEHYRDFHQVDDAEVAAMLDSYHRDGDAGGQAQSVSRSVVIGAGNTRLTGDLTIPGEAVGLVIFAHGSGSSRRSPRNMAVARVLNQSGLATLLFDLLTDAEADDRRNVFDIALLARRLALATDWARSQPDLSHLPMAYFGASTGAAAALVAAAHSTSPISAVVSRGGRADLAADALPMVAAPTLLIVGGADHEVLALNRDAQRLMRCESRLDVIPGATHLFEEPGALESVADLAGKWFLAHYGRGAHAGATAPARASRG